MDDTLSVNLVAALSGRDERTVRKEIEHGILGSPQLGFPVLVYFDVLANLDLDLGVKDRGKVYQAISRAIATHATLVRLGGILMLDITPSIAKGQKAQSEFETWQQLRVVSDPEVMGGEPTFKDSRLTVRRIGGMLSKGEPIEDIREDYPYLTDEDVKFAKIYFRAYPKLGRRASKTSP